MMEIGALSEWVMIVIAIITAYFLYKTLKSQKEVQQTQNELFRIEHKRFKESIKPILRYSPSTDIFKPSNEKQKILTVQVSSKIGQALNISVHTKCHQIFIPTDLSGRRNYLDKGDSPLSYNFLIEDGDSLMGWVIFELMYDDITGCKYKQRVVCICYQSDIEISVNLPEELSSE